MIRKDIDGAIACKLLHILSSYHPPIASKRLESLLITLAEGQYSRQFSL